MTRQPSSAGAGASDTVVCADTATRRMCQCQLLEAIGNWLPTVIEPNCGSTNIVRALVFLRQHLGLNINQLAAEVGVGRTILARCESQPEQSALGIEPVMPTPPVLRRLAHLAARSGLEKTAESFNMMATRVQGRIARGWKRGGADSGGSGSGSNSSNGGGEL